MILRPDYFKTWGIPILAGRDFDEHDTTGQPNVLLISQGGAKKIFGSENPIGKTLLYSSSSIPAEIIGVVGDVRSRKVAEPDDVELYRPWAQENFPFLSIEVRSDLKTETVTKSVRSALASVDPGLAIALPQSMNTIVAQAVGQTRLMTWLLGIFAGVALLLASIGIYGAVAYTVEQRTGEIGLRMALGAQRSVVLRMIVRRGLMLALIGVGFGAVVSAMLTRLMSGLLFETRPTDPVTYAATALLLLTVSVAASSAPAYRAARLDPIETLREQ
jgi:putative ABC transport system permease protein